MAQRNFFSIMIFIYTFLLTSIPLYAQEEGEIIIISERVGKEIDREEREKFKFFQAVNGFQKAVCYKLPDNNYIWEITYFDEKTNELKEKFIRESESSINKYRNYIDHFEEIQAEKHQIMSSDSGEIQAHQDTVNQEPGTALFLELGGKLFSSVNADFRINKSNRFSIGIFPSLMYYHLRGDKYKKFEIGLGFTVIPTSGEGGFFLHGVIGYRYQKKNGLLFRIGFTPIVIVDEWSFIPWVGISFGYSL